MACEVWGPLWSRKCVLFHCDNMAVVQLWRSGLSKAPLFMHLVRALFFVAATNNFHVTITHIAGVDNSIADSLSRRLSGVEVQPSRPRRRCKTHPHTSPADPALVSMMSQLVEGAVAPSTRRVNAAGVGRFQAFCASHGTSSLLGSKAILYYPVS